MHKIILTFSNEQIAHLLLQQIWAAFQIKGSLIQENDSSFMQFNDPPSAEIIHFIEKFSGDVKSFAQRAQAKSLVTFGSQTPQVLKPIQPKNFLMSKTPGVVAYLGQLGDLIEEVDQFILKEVAPFKAHAIPLAQIISEKELKQMGYLPRDKKQIAELQVYPPLHENCCLTPAVCLPLYPLLPQLVKTTENLVFCTRGFAHRNESGNFDSETPALRLRHFQVRELIRVCNPLQISETRNFFISFAEKFSKHFGVQIQVVTANDIFFEPQDTKTAILQLLSQSKLEMVTQIGEMRVSLGSFNSHEDHFTSLYLPEDKNLSSCCIGIGLERAAYAIACRRGGKYE